MLVILILQQSLKCKTCNARKSVFVKEKKKIAFANYKTCKLIAQNVKKHTYNVCPKKLIIMTNIKIKVFV